MAVTIGSMQGIVVTLSPIGASMTSLVVPDASGTPRDVLLGLASERSYRDNPHFLGASVGRCVNRIGKARFSLDGVEYRLTANDGTNCNHGGRDFWGMREWQLVESDGEHASFLLDSPHMDQGFPGRVRVTATYRVTGRELDVTYAATADMPTVINMTSHGYFNLNGHDSGCAMGHLLWVNASRRLESDETVLPTGRILDVADTPWDFRSLRPINSSMPSAGFDNCFVLKDATAGTDAAPHGGESADNARDLRLVARLVGEKSGIAMDLLTNQPGMQLYTANFASVPSAKGGVTYQPRDAVCLEPSLFPDAINHPEWPSPVFGPDRPYLWRMRLRFHQA